jgi:hypothetical protein
MRSTHRSSIVLASVIIVAGLAGCGTDTPTTPAAAESTALERSNSFITLSFPGSIQSQAWGIDPSGKVVVGGYRTEDQAVHGYVFAKGAFTTIDYPGAAFSIGTGINGRGEIVGWWEEANGIQHGYVKWHGVFTTTDVPEALSTRITGINASGDIVGAFDARDGRSPGFVRRSGKFTAIEPSPGADFTVAKGISSSGDVVGYWDGRDGSHGFLLSHGRYTKIDFPGSTGTGVAAVNDEGTMLGWYTTPTATSMPSSSGTAASRPSMFPSRRSLGGTGSTTGATSSGFTTTRTAWSRASYDVSDRVANWAEPLQASARFWSSWEAWSNENELSGRAPWTREPSSEAAWKVRPAVSSSRLVWSWPARILRRRRERRRPTPWAEWSLA